MAAHTTGPYKRCAFCSCPEFQAEPREVPRLEGVSDAVLAALELLAQNPAFAHVPVEHMADIARHGQKRLFLSDSVLMVEGEPSDLLFFLVKGQVRVEAAAASHKARLIAELGPGEFVGEMGVLRHKPRSATVTAIADLETLELGFEQIKAVFRDDHDLMLGFLRVIQKRQSELRH
ncbi:MAG TPA: Crp/Fnr family transcriptional regulator [Chloroflexota bacterium]|nr:Crp/Fnr family transcriptional regulator [Chloroflexota bacterium]